MFHQMIKYTPDDPHLVETSSILTTSRMYNMLLNKGDFVSISMGNIYQDFNAELYLITAYRNLYDAMYKAKPKFTKTREELKDMRQCALARRIETIETKQDTDDTVIEEGKATYPQGVVLFKRRNLEQRSDWSSVPKAYIPIAERIPKKYGPRRLSLRLNVTAKR
jgi:hypothetical protein